MRVFFREFLTITASGLVILLTLAAVIPPFWPWERSREQLESHLNKSLQVPVKTEGYIRFRLLPTPVLEVERLLVGESAAAQPFEAPSARFENIILEASLLPLLKKQLNIVRLHSDYVDVSLLADDDGNAIIPSIPFALNKNTTWTVAIEDMRILGGRYRTLKAGQSDPVAVHPFQVDARAPSLYGPWRINGHFHGLIFDTFTGDVNAENALPFKAIIGGGAMPRFELEGQVSAKKSPDDPLPYLTGKLKMQAGPPVQPSDTTWAIPTTLTANVASSREGISFNDIQVDAGEGMTALKGSGEGLLTLKPKPHLKVNLSAPRLDMDAFWLSSAGTVFAQMINRPKVVETQPPTPSPMANWPLTARVDFKTDEIWAAGEVLEKAFVELQFNKGVLSLHHLEAIPPGGGVATFQGIGEGGDEGRIKGKLVLTSGKPVKLASWLGLFDIPTGLLVLSNGQSVDMTADINVYAGIQRIRDINWRSGTSELVGTLERRYFAQADAKVLPKPKVTADLKAKGFDLARIPALPTILKNVTHTDLDVTLDAQELQFTSMVASSQSAIPNMPARSRQFPAGSWQTHLTRNADGLHFHRLKITGLGGLNAELMGDVSSTGAGKISGTLNAVRLEPFAVLMSKLTGYEQALDWLPDAMRDAPLEGTLDLVSLAQEPILPPEFQASSKPIDYTTPPINASFKGMMNRVALNFDLSTSNTMSLEKAHITLNAAQKSDMLPLLGLRNNPQFLGEGTAHIILDITHPNDKPLTLSAQAIFPDMRLSTTRPMPLKAGMKDDDLGEVRVVYQPQSTASPQVDITARVGFEASYIKLRPNGQIMSEAFEGNIGFDPKDRIYWGEINTGKLSLPALALPLGLGERSATPDGRFNAPVSFPLSGDIVVFAQNMALSPTITTQNARITFALNPERLVLKDMTTQFNKADITGTLTLKHQNGRGSISGHVDVSDTHALTPELHDLFGGRLQTRMNLGASGETFGAMLANLNGQGEMIWQEPSVMRLAPQALFEVAKWAFNPPSSAQETPTKVMQKINQLFNAAPFHLEEENAQTFALTLSGGVIRSSTVALSHPNAKVTGQFNYDLKQGLLNARADVQATQAPAGWSGQPPLASIIWKGTLQNISRDVDATSLINVLTSARNKRERDLNAPPLPPASRDAAQMLDPAQTDTNVASTITSPLPPERPLSDPAQDDAGELISE